MPDIEVTQPKKKKRWCLWGGLGACGCCLTPFIVGLIIGMVVINSICDLYYKAWGNGWLNAGRKITAAAVGSAVGGPPGAVIALVTEWQADRIIRTKMEKYCGNCNGAYGGGTFNLGEGICIVTDEGITNTNALTYDEAIDRLHKKGYNPNADLVKQIFNKASAEGINPGLLLSIWGKEQTFGNPSFAFGYGRPSSFSKQLAGAILTIKQTIDNKEPYHYSESELYKPIFTRWIDKYTPLSEPINAGDRKNVSEFLNILIPNSIACGSVSTGLSPGNILQGKGGILLSVPGVQEDARGHCGLACASSVIQYFTGKPYTTNQLYSRYGGYYWADNLNRDTGKTWKKGNYKSDNFQGILQALDKGYPSIVGTQYPLSGGTKHFVVIIGYDPGTDTFTIISPRPGGVNVGQKVSRNWLINHPHTDEGNSYYAPQ